MLYLTSDDMIYWFLCITTHFCCPFVSFSVSFFLEALSCGLAQDMLFAFATFVLQTKPKQKRYCISWQFQRWIPTYCSKYEVSNHVFPNTVCSVWFRTVLLSMTSCHMFVSDIFDYSLPLTRWYSFTNETIKRTKVIPQLHPEDQPTAPWARSNNTSHTQNNGSNNIQYVCVRGGGRL